MATDLCRFYQREQKLRSCLWWEHSYTLKTSGCLLPWPISKTCQMRRAPLKKQICLNLYISLLPSFYLTQWNVHVNDLMSLSMDWNRFTCPILLETASLIGWGCRPRPNHRASPRSLAANGRTKMVFVVSLSPREGGETSWHVKQWVDLVGESILFVCRVKPDQSSWSLMLFLWRVLQTPTQTYSQHIPSAVIGTARVTRMNERISRSLAWRWCVSMATCFIVKAVRTVAPPALSLITLQTCPQSLF